MHRKIIYCLLYISIVTNFTISSFFNYFPTKVGNIYVYKLSGNGSTVYIRTEVTKDSVFNNHRYYYFQNSPLYGTDWLRVDSVTSNLMVYNVSNSCSLYVNESPIDSLNARLNDGEPFCSAMPSPIFSCYDTSFTSIFNSQFQKKGFRFMYFNTLQIRSYLYNIGYYNGVFQTQTGGSNLLLVGCVVNNIVYGDTTLVGLSQISTEAPVDFNLHQNFPNPFNPTTTIKFDLSKSSHINLVICDMLGREIYSITDEYLKAGSYLFVWDAKEHSSGIYFYRLTTNNYSETKKMILLK